MKFWKIALNALAILVDIVLLTFFAGCLFGLVDVGKGASIILAFVLGTPMAIGLTGAAIFTSSEL